MPPFDPAAASRTAPRTPSLPPPSDDAPPRVDLPIDAPLPHEDHFAAGMVHGALEFGAEVLAEFGPAGMVPGAAGGMVGAAVVGGVANAMMMYEVFSLPGEAAADGMLQAAFPRDGSAESRACATGAATVLSGMSVEDSMRLRATLPRGLRDDFDRGAGFVSDMAERNPPAFERASEHYTQISTQFADGTAAALGGWSDASRGEAFEAGRAQMAEYLDAHPREASQLRAEYRSAHRAGFLAADGRGVDRARARRDPAYRSGIAHHERCARQGTLAQERDRVVGSSARSLGGAPIAG